VHGVVYIYTHDKHNLETENMIGCDESMESYQTHMRTVTHTCTKAWDIHHSMAILSTWTKFYFIVVIEHTLLGTRAQKFGPNVLF